MANCINKEDQIQVDFWIDELKTNIFKLTGRLAYVYVEGTEDADTTANVLTFIHLICEIWGTSLQQLVVKDRHAHLVVMRHVIFYMVRKKHPRYSTSSLGRIFKCDHSTVINGYQNIENYLVVKDPATMIYYNPVKHLLNG